jgi:hypothetical protein
MSHLLIVMGCHRSGTSLVARSLKALGAELGDAAEWSGPDNPTGFWEHQGVLAVNEKVLEICGARWDAPPTLFDVMRACDQQPDLTYLSGAAEHMLRRELDRYPVFGIKEPRLCVLMAFWRRIVSGLGCDVSVVRAIRHPDAVARSLQRRDGMTRDRALNLWLRYVEGSTDGRTAWPSVTVDYDAMMAEPIQQVARIGKHLGLPVDKIETVRFATDFVNEDLWHEAEDGSLPVEIDIVWQQLRREAMEP